MFCLKCGEVVPEDASFCPVCGTKIGEKEDEKKAIVYVEKMNADNSVYKNKGRVAPKVLKNENWFRGITVVMCIIAIILIIFGYKSVTNSSYEYAVDNCEYYERQMKETKSMANIYGGSGILGGGYASLASSWEDMLEEAQTTIIVGRVKAGVSFGLGFILLAGVVFLFLKRKKGDGYTYAEKGGKHSVDIRLKKMSNVLSNTKGKKYTVVAAICLSIYNVIGIYNVVLPMIKYDFYTISFTTVISYIASIAFVILLFVGKKNIGFLVTSFAIIALYVYGIIEIAPAGFSIEAMGISLLGIAEYLILFVLFLFSVIDTLSKNDKVIKFMWFVPAVICLTSCIVQYIRWEYFSNLAYTWMYIFEDLCAVLALLFVGLWLREDKKRIDSNKEILNDTTMVINDSTNNEM